MKIRGLRFRIAAVFVAMSMMLSLVSCDLHGFRSKIISDPLSSQELVRLMINAINDKKAVADSYASIPEMQRDGLSYSYFIQFIDILTGISSANSDGEDITYFRMLSDEEVYTVTEETNDSYYGNVKGAELLYGEEQEGHGVYLMFSEDNEGMPYLSEEWISDVIELYNYGEHYFEMIDIDSADGLATLMRPGLDPDVFDSDEALLAKAQEVLYYYEISVRGDLSDNMKSMVTVLLPEHIRITIPETLNYETNRVVKHEVDITMEDGSYKIEDDIPVVQDVSLTQVFLQGEVLFTCGSSYTASHVVELMGEPVMATYYPDSETFSMCYDGLILVFYLNDYQDDDNWSGVLSTIKIQGGSSYTIGNGLYIGMTRTQVLETYPYMHEQDYTVNIDNGIEDCKVEIALESHNDVSYIRVTVV